MVQKFWIGLLLMFLKKVFFAYQGLLACFIYLFIGLKYSNYHLKKAVFCCSIF